MAAVDSNYIGSASLAAAVASMAEYSCGIGPAFVEVVPDNMTNWIADFDGSDGFDDFDDFDGFDGDCDVIQ